MDDSSLHSVLSNIDTFSSEKNRQDLLFLSRAFASGGDRERLAQHCTTLAVLDILHRQDISDSEAVLVLQRMLKTARYDEKRTYELKSCTDTVMSGSSAYLELIKKLSFHELLLILSHKIDYSKAGQKVLKHLLEKIPEAKVKAHKQDIKSALRLFTSMLTAGTLDPSRPVTMISELRDLWHGVTISSDELVQMLIDEVDDAVARNVTQVGESWEVKQQIEVEDNKNLKKIQCHGKCNRCTKCMSVMIAVVGVFILIPFITVASRCFPLTNNDADFKLKPQLFETWTSALFWAFEMPFTTTRYSSITIHVEQPPESQVEYTINATLITCDAKEGPPRTVLQNNSETYTITDCDPNYPKTWQISCPVNFTDAGDATDEDIVPSASPYILNGSHFKVTLDTESLRENETVDLYVHTNVTVCSIAYYIPQLYNPHNLVTGGPIKFSKLGNKSYHLKSNSNKFFCGFWAFNFSATLNYTISRYIIGYDDTVRPVQHRSYSHTKPSNNSFEFMHHSSQVCLLVDITNPNYGSLNLTLVPEKMKISKCLISSVFHIILCAVILALFTTAMIVIIVLSALLLYKCHCYCCCVNKNIYYQEIEDQSHSI